MDYGVYAQPDEDNRKAVCQCECCGIDIFDGEHCYQIENKFYCNDCCRVIHAEKEYEEE